MASQFTITDEVDAGIVTVRLTGDIDLGVSRAVLDHISGHIGEPTLRGIVVDLAGVTFLDSSGISSLVAGRKAALAAGQTFGVSNAAGTVAQVLDLTGLLEILTAG